MLTPKQSQCSTNKEIHWSGLRCEVSSVKNFFYQDLVLNYAHQNANELVRPNGQEFPQQIRNFAAAWFLRPEIWRQEKSVKFYLNLQGHKDHYIETALSFWRSRVHYLNLCQRQVIGNFRIDLHSEASKDAELTRNQTRVKSMVKDFLTRRSDHYDDVPEVDVESESGDDDSVGEAEYPRVPASTELIFNEALIL